MTRASLTLNSDEAREKAARWCMKLPHKTRVEFKAPKRSLPQNAKMWAALTDISQQVTWHGLKLTPGDWKQMFLDALKREARMVPNLDSNGYVNLGRSSSDLGKDEMAELLELIAAWGAQHGVVFQGNDPTEGLS